MKMCSRCLFMSPSRALICMTCGGIKFLTNDRPAGQADAESPDESRNLISISRHASEFPEFAREIAQECSKKAFSGLVLVGDAAGQQFRSMQSEMVQLIPKIKSAYKKVVALATVPHRDGTVGAVDCPRVEESQPVQWTCRYEDAEKADLARNLYDFTPALAIRKIARAEQQLQAAPLLSESRKLPVLLRNLLNENHEASRIVDELSFEGEEPELQLSTGGFVFFAVPDLEYDETPVEEISSEILEKLRKDLEVSHEWFRNYGRDGFLSGDGLKESSKASDDDDDSANHRSAA